MSGVKGQKWKTDRPPPRIKKSVALKVSIYDKVKAIAKENKLSISSAIEFVLECYFDKVK